MSLAEKAADFVNRAVASIVQKSVRDAELYDYFYVGIFGYGVVPETGREGVGSLLADSMGPGPLVGVRRLAEHPLRLVPQVDAGGLDAPMPVWVEAAHGGRACVCQAVDEIGKHLLTWSAAQRSGPPPVVVNVTDGQAGDDSLDGAGLAEWYERLTRVSTDLGVVKVFDAIVSITPGHVVLLRPATTAALTQPGWTVVELSRLLPNARISTWASDALVRDDVQEV